MPVLMKARFRVLGAVFGDFHGKTGPAAIFEARGDCGYWREDCGNWRENSGYWRPPS